MALLDRIFARFVKLTGVFTKNLVGVTHVEQMASVVDQLTNEVNDGSGTTWNEDTDAVDLGGRISGLSELYGFSVGDQLKAGALLPTFSVNGGIARGGIRYQSDGKIIVIGKFTSVNSDTKWRFVVRLNTDYTIDETFNPPVIGTYHGDGIQCGDVDANDKILIGGAIASVDGDTTYKNLIRLNADGTHDTTFAKATASNSGWPHAVHVGSTGRIGVAGRLNTWIGASGPIQYAIILESDGTPVSGFQSQGTGFDSLAWSCRLQDDDKLLVGGQFVSYNGVQSRALARLNIDGTLDATFSANMGDGFRNSTDSNMDVWAIDLGYDNLGTPVIYCGGDFFQFNLEVVGHLIALNTDGTRNTVFQVGTGINSGVYEIVWSDWWWGVWVGGGFNQYNGQTTSGVALINPDGELVEDFSSNYGGTVYAIGDYIAHPFDTYLPDTILCGKSTSNLRILNYYTGKVEYSIRGIYLIGSDKAVIGNLRALKRAKYWEEPPASTSDLDILSKKEIADYVGGEIVRQSNVIFIDSDTGNDSTGNGSEQTPYATIQRAWTDRIASATTRVQYYKFFIKGTATLDYTLTLDISQVNAPTEFEGIGVYPNITLTTSGVVAPLFLGGFIFKRCQLTYAIDEVAGEPLVYASFEMYYGTFYIDANRRLNSLFLNHCYLQSDSGTRVLKVGYLFMDGCRSVATNAVPNIRAVNADIIRFNAASYVTISVDDDLVSSTVNLYDCITASIYFITFADSASGTLQVNINGSLPRYTTTFVNALSNIQVYQETRNVIVHNDTNPFSVNIDRHQNALIECVNTGGVSLPSDGFTGWEIEVINKGSVAINVVAATLYPASPVVLEPEQSAVFYANGTGGWTAKKGGGSGGGALVIEEVALPVTTGNLTLAFDTPVFYTPYGATATGIINFLLDNTDAVVGTTKRVEIDFDGFEPTFDGVAWDDVTQTKFRFLAGFPDNTPGLTNIMEFRWITTDKVDVVVSYI